MPLPYYVQVEPTTRCNLKCPYCTRSTYNKEDLKADLDESFIDLVLKNKNLRILKIQGMGEPFAYKNLEKIVKKAKNKGLVLETTTNGTTLLNNFKDRKLLLENFDIVNISIDAGTKETFEEYSTGANFEKVIDGISLLNMERIKSNSKLQIIAAFVITHQNFKEIPIFINMMKNIGIKKLGFPEIENWKIPSDLDYKYYADQHMEYLNKRIEIEGYLRKELGSELLGYPNLLWTLKRGPRKGNCDWGFYNAFYTESGLLTPCCIRMENKYALNPKNDLTLEDNWNSVELQEFRLSHLNNLKNIYCDNCPG